MIFLFVWSKVIHEGIEEGDMAWSEYEIVVDPEIEQLRSIAISVVKFVYKFFEIISPQLYDISESNVDTVDVEIEELVVHTEVKAKEFDDNVGFASIEREYVGLASIIERLLELKYGS